MGAHYLFTVLLVWSTSTYCRARINMTIFEGKFVNTNDENLDEFYTAIGIPWVPRKMLTASSPTMEISLADGSWTIEVSTLASKSSNTFKLGEEYDETMQGGRTIKNVTRIEGNSIITESESDKGTSKKVMEFDDKGFIMVLTHASTDIVAKRHFNRV